MYGAMISGLCSPSGRIASEKALPRSWRTSRHVFVTDISSVSEEQMEIFVLGSTVGEEYNSKDLDNERT